MFAAYVKNLPYTIIILVNTWNAKNRVRFASRVERKHTNKNHVGSISHLQHKSPNAWFSRG